MYRYTAVYIRNIIPDDVSIALVGTWPYRGGAVLILRVALAALFHKLAASEVADEHQVVISYIKDKAPRVWCVLGVKTGYPRRAPFEVDDSAIMDFIFVYPGWSFLSHKRKSTYRTSPRCCYKRWPELRRTRVLRTSPFGDSRKSVSALSPLWPVPQSSRPSAPGG